MPPKIRAKIYNYDEDEQQDVSLEEAAEMSKDDTESLWIYSIYDTGKEGE